MEMIKLQTICTMELWAGYFGIDEDGNQPECGEVINIKVEQEDIETDEDGTIRPCYAIRCPKCKMNLEWPQAWETVT